MAKVKTVRKLVSLNDKAKSIVRSHANHLQLGGRGFSTALNLIVMEWAELRKKSNGNPTPPPSQE